MKRTPLIIVIATLACTACSNPMVEHSAGKEWHNAPPLEGTSLPPTDFQIEDGWLASGTVYVRGYAEVRQEDQYVVFFALESSSKSFDAYLHMNAGNAFAGDNFVGIGCLQNGEIAYENMTDVRGMQTHIIDHATTNAILHSWPDSPITIALQKDTWSGGGGAPSCYSHFSSISIPHFSP